MVIKVKKRNWRRAETRYVITAGNVATQDGDAALNGSTKGFAFVAGITGAFALLALVL